MSKTSKQKIYKITLSKTFEFPSCVIDEGNFLSDLHQKAVEDFISAVGKDRIRITDFNYKLEAEVPFKIKSSRDKPNLTGAVTEEGISLDYIVRELATVVMEDEYGSLSDEDNDEVFAHNEDGDCYMIEEVENEWEALIDKFNNVIRRRIL